MSVPHRALSRLHRNFLLLCLASSLAIGSLAAQQPKDLAPVVQAEAQNWAKALITNDHTAMLDYMPERIVTRMGGKEAALDLLKKGAEAMKAKGLGVEEAIIGVPVPPQRIDNWLVSVMTETLSLKTPTAKATQESHLLAISADEGKTWKFLDLAPLNDDKFYAVFPELKGKFKLPPKKSAVAEKAP